MLLLALMALSLLPRGRFLAASEALFSSDEAVNALVLRQALEHGEFRLFNWDTRYYGVVEAWLTAPLVPVLGFRAVTFKLGALIGLWLFAAALYRLAIRHWGATAGLVAAGCALFFSRTVTYWSLLAAGGYFLIVAWGTWSFDRLDRAAERREPWSRRTAVEWFTLGLAFGFGLYIYRLFLVFLAAAAIWLVQRAVVRWRAGSAFGARAALWAGSGFALGAVPVALGRWLEPSPGRDPTLGLATAAQMAENVRLLFATCLPNLLGGDGQGRIPVAGWAAIALCGVAISAWVLGRRRTWLETAITPWQLPELLALLLVVNLAAFVASPNPVDLLSSRYLLPTLATFATALGWLVSRAPAGRWRAACAVVVAAPFLAGAAQAARQPWHPIPDPLPALIEALREHHVSAAYAPYWVAYAATFRAKEELVFDATDWSRNPAYARAADSALHPGWVFAVDPPAMDATRIRQAAEALARFERRLERGGLRAEIVEVPHFRIFLDSQGGRLLPPPIREPPRALGRHDAQIEFVEVPASTAVGSRSRVKVRLTNRSDGPWWTEGDAQRAGLFQVNVSYRWLATDGAVIVAEGDRSPLPWDLAQGDSLETFVEVAAPLQGGRHRLRMTLVQEGVAWFDQATPTAKAEIDVDVSTP